MIVGRGGSMEIDTDKIDETVLALLYLTSYSMSGSEIRAWKGHSWEVLSRLYEKGYIHDPVNKAKSVGFREGGHERAKELFEAYFTKGS
jgi:RNA:NAD 2'-phosphotransferase (TPT1/KptA family)